MKLWQQVLTLILTPTLAVGAITYLIRKLFESGLQRDLERFKSSLELERFKNQTKFSLIHQKQADVVSGLYSRLARSKMLIVDLVAMFHPADSHYLIR